MMTWLFDLLFPPDVADDGPALRCITPEGASTAAAAAAALSDLMAMGFDEGAARSALVASKGSLQEAVGALLG